MDKYLLKYNQSNKRLSIILKDQWSLEDAIEYQNALKDYVAGLSVETVLIDQCYVAEFPPEVIEVFKENNKIPQLEEAKVACFLDPLVFRFMMEQLKDVPKLEISGVPKYFDSKEKAEEYLND